MSSSNHRQAKPGQQFYAEEEEEENVVAEMMPSSPGAREVTSKVEDSGLDAFCSA